MWLMINTIDGELTTNGIYLYEDKNNLLDVLYTILDGSMSIGKNLYIGRNNRGFSIFPNNEPDWKEKLESLSNEYSDFYAFIGSNDYFLVKEAFPEDRSMNIKPAKR